MSGSVWMFERAGYLSTPNIQTDPLICTRVDSGSPAALHGLAAVRITPDTPDLSGNAAFALNQAAGQTITPDQILLSGSYAATDEFPVSDASSGSNIYLQVNTPSMARLGYLSASGSASQLALLQNVFGVQPGQILRVKDQSGMLYFAPIASVTAGSQPYITLSTPLPIKSSSSTACGLRGFEMGASANVVNLVRYRVMDFRNDAQGAAFKPLFDSSAGDVGEASRTELVRDQINAAGATIAGSADIVAEYAVDLGFSVMGQVAAGTPTVAPSAPTDATFVTYFAANATGDRPQGVRSVRVRLSVRSREADRNTNIAGGLYRFQVGTNAWSRVRTFQADVALPNQRNVRW
jgi:hypothetical protein